MSDLYTTNEVQQLLKVDRVTVYRMLNDGRLAGVKIGHQWRFKKDEVDKLLNNNGASAAPPELGDATHLPLSCYATIQNLVSDLSSLDTIITDLDGYTLTEPDIRSALNLEIIGKPGGLESNKFHWMAFAQQSLHGRQYFTAPTGVCYTSIMIQDGGAPAAVFLCGGYLDQQVPVETRLMRQRDISQTWNIPLDVVQDLYNALPIYGQAEKDRLDRWMKSILNAITSAQSERSHFIGRMNQIAHLTRI